MTHPTPAEINERYMICSRQLGECYCAKNLTGPCYSGPVTANRGPCRNNRRIMALAAAGILILPLAPVAAVLGWRAWDHPKCGHRACDRRASGALFAGIVGTVILGYMAAVIIAHHI